VFFSEDKSDRFGFPRLIKNSLPLELLLHPEVMAYSEHPNRHIYESFDLWLFREVTNPMKELREKGKEDFMWVILKMLNGRFKPAQAWEAISSPSQTPS
jgi:hypothetical protein